MTEATCNNPIPFVDRKRGHICDFSACYCNAPTVRDKVSGKCVNLKDCPRYNKNKPSQNGDSIKENINNRQKRTSKPYISYKTKKPWKPKNKNRPDKEKKIRYKPYSDPNKGIFWVPTNVKQKYSKNIKRQNKKYRVFFLHG